MAWNEPGNSGNGGNDPWGNRGNQGGDQPPDLDEVVRNLQSKVRGIFGGGGGGQSRGTGSGSRGFLGIALAALAVWLIVDSVYIIDESQRGVVMTFGDYTGRTLQPGLRIVGPRPIWAVDKVNVTQIRSEQTEGDMLTRDENIVEAVLSVQYLVKNAEDYLFQVKDPDVTLEQAAESAMRQVIGDNNMDFVLLEGRAEVTQQIRTILQEILDSYRAGLELTAVNLEELRPPDEVKEAFDDAIKAREDKERLEDQAKAYAGAVVPEARGVAEQIRQDALAYQASAVEIATGEAERFNLLLDEYLKAPEVTRQRLYLETMESVMAKSSKVLVDMDQGNNVMYLPLDQIAKSSIPAMQRSQSQSSSDSNSPQYQTNSVREGRRGRDGR